MKKKLKVLGKKIHMVFNQNDVELFMQKITRWFNGQKITPGSTTLNLSRFAKPKNQKVQNKFKFF